MIIKVYFIFNNLVQKIIIQIKFYIKEIIKLDRKIENEKDFIIGNLDVFGFYRINYDEENWNKIINQLSLNKEVK